MNAADRVMPETPPPDDEPDADDLLFTGLQLYRDPSGELRVRAFDRGMIIELAPNEADHGRALGFYDLNMRPVPAP